MCSHIKLCQRLPTFSVPLSHCFQDTNHGPAARKAHRFSPPCIGTGYLCQNNAQNKDAPSCSCMDRTTTANVSVICCHGTLSSPLPEAIFNTLRIGRRDVVVTICRQGRCPGAARLYPGCRWAEGQAQQRREK